jgi:hypothetical protein
MNYIYTVLVAVTVAYSFAVSDDTMHRGSHRSRRRGLSTDARKGKRGREAPKEGRDSKHSNNKQETGDTKSQKKKLVIMEMGSWALALCGVAHGPTVCGGPYAWLGHAFHTDGDGSFFFFFFFRKWRWILLNLRGACALLLNSPRLCPKQGLLTLPLLNFFFISLPFSFLNLDKWSSSFSWMQYLTKLN